jgi:hypothetical protein
MNSAVKGLLAVGLAGGLGFAATSTAVASPATGTTIAFTEHETSDRTFNLGTGHGVAVGFIELAANDDIQAGRKIGHDGSSCTITRVSEGTADDLCDVTFVLTQGQIDAAGLVTSTQAGPGTFTVAIVGGTGAYSNAHGQATVISARSPKVTLHFND